MLTILLNTLPGIIPVEVALLLPVHPSDDFHISLSKSSIHACSLSSLRTSLTILPRRLSSRIVILLSKPSYARAAPCTRGSPSLFLSTVALGLSSSVSHSHIRSHPCSSSPGPSCTVSTLSPESPAVVGPSDYATVLTTHSPAAYSPSRGASGLSSHHRTTGSKYSRSTVPSASGCSVYIFRNIRATLPSYVKYAPHPCFSLVLLSVRLKFFAISCNCKLLLDSS